MNINNEQYEIKYKTLFCFTEAGATGENPSL